MNGTTTADSANARDSLTELGKALARLKEALNQPSDNPLAIDGTIQRFEFTIELCWKTLKKLVEAEGEEAKFPRQALQQAYQAGWIDNEKLWIDMLKDRNLTSHTYKEELANEIYQRIHLYYPALAALYQVLIQRYPL